MDKMYLPAPIDMLAPSPGPLSINCGPEARRGGGEGSAS